MQQSGVPIGIVLGSAGPTAGAAPAGNQTTELQILSKQFFIASFGPAALVVLSGPEPAEVLPTPAYHQLPTLPGWGCLMGRGGEGFSWDGTELRVVGLVTPAAWAPMDVPSPETALLSSSVTWRDACPGRLSTEGRETKNIHQLLVEGEPYLSSLSHLISSGYLSPSLQICSLSSPPPEERPAYSLLMFVLCPSLSTFYFMLLLQTEQSEHTQCFSLSFPKSFPSRHGKKPASPSCSQH